mmetsp:Transcript_28097/g.53523  ORF Transcript_28097/g.53523 Transcript_28097/m.53523 type:complete len:171 (-) Transcript_28097:196-708(-)
MTMLAVFQQSVSVPRRANRATPRNYSAAVVNLQRPSLKRGNQQGRIVLRAVSEQKPSTVSAEPKAELKRPDVVTAPDLVSKQEPGMEEAEEDRRDVPAWLSDDVWEEGGENEFWLFKEMRYYGEKLSMPSDDIEGQGSIMGTIDRTVLYAMLGGLPLYTYALWKAFQDTR